MIPMFLEVEVRERERERREWNAFACVAKMAAELVQTKCDREQMLRLLQPARYREVPSSSGKQEDDTSLTVD